LCWEVVAVGKEEELKYKSYCDIINNEDERVNDAYYKT